MFFLYSVHDKLVFLVAHFFSSKLSLALKMVFCRTFPLLSEALKSLIEIACSRSHWYKNLIYYMFDISAFSILSYLVLCTTKAVLRFHSERRMRSELFLIGESSLWKRLMIRNIS